MVDASEFTLLTPDCLGITVTNPVIIRHSSFDDPHAALWFVEPAGFTALPFDGLLPASGSQAADNLRKAAAPLLDTSTDELARQRVIAQFATAQQLLAALREVGTVHCSVGLHRDDVSGVGGPGGVAVVGPLFSLFTISWRETAAAPRSVTAARAVTAVGGHAGVEFVELPAGPATFSESTSAPGSGSGLPQRSLLQLHAHLPHPDCRRLAVLTLTTTAPARREEYRAILRAIAGSVSFESPG